jgi:hypothetical protein
MRLINWAHIGGIYLPAFWILALLYLAWSVYSHHPSMVDAIISIATFKTAHVDISIPNAVGLGMCCCR